MKVALGQGADTIVGVINKYCKLSLGQWTRAMYKKLKPPYCLWFPQCSLKAPGMKDLFKPSLSAENWLSSDGLTIYERAKSASMDSALDANNAFVRIAFANLLPKHGYEFIGVFRFAGRKNGFRVYKRISDVADTNQW